MSPQRHPGVSTPQPAELAERSLAFVRDHVRSELSAYLMLAAGVPSVDLQHVWQGKLRRWDPWEAGRSVCLGFM